MKLGSQKMVAWVVSLALGLSSTAVLAQMPIKSATVDELVEQLAPAKVTTRSIRNVVPSPKSLDLSIQFAFNSARIESVSQPLLANLAQALGSERLLSSQVLIEGHTDAKGSEAYNDELSLRRADAVAEFLSASGIEVQRMTTVGKGFHELLLKNKPYAEQNRRVKIQASFP